MDLCKVKSYGFLTGVMELITSAAGLGLPVRDFSGSNLTETP
jgi:hypothetical protein